MMNEFLKSLYTRAVAEGITPEICTLIKREILLDAKVNRAEAEFLIELLHTAPRVCDEYRQFVFSIAKRVVLTDAEITPGETAWLRRMLFGDHRVDSAERALLKELREAAIISCPEFDELCAQYESV